MPRTPATPPANPFNIQESSHPLITVSSRVPTGNVNAITYPVSAGTETPRLTFQTRHGSTYIDEAQLDAVIAVLMRYRSLLGDTEPAQMEVLPDDEEAEVDF